jgi:DNA replicative helicase MCM subunit Mcm2 (Cdc46/Mcm family)
VKRLAVTVAFVCPACGAEVEGSFDDLVGVSASHCECCGSTASVEVQCPKCQGFQEIQ